MFELFVEYRDVAQWLISIVLGFAMFRWGSAPERFVAAVFVGLFTLPIIVFEVILGIPLLYAAGGLYYASIDIVAAIAFTVIAVNANRNYTLWIAGFQLVAMSAHGVRFVTEAVTPLAHAVMVIGPSYFQLALMAVGLFRHVSRSKRYGEYRDWRVPRREIKLAMVAGGEG
ncbi:hypothetical protein [Erythrobacter sp. JK5]|uniref:hypothetical protein n=1 Tax=Erythrobacter sp. JK5 TaxID=2829500 RepID=UPI001BAC6637|nr:hypothetical protein [Erythrobacter sp. JK5]QUL37802.1 hypothetical protein KDC96_15965 [Erythrobacter sp. JK5]